MAGVSTSHLPPVSGPTSHQFLGPTHFLPPPPPPVTNEGFKTPTGWRCCRSFNPHGPPVLKATPPHLVPHPSLIITNLQVYGGANQAQQLSPYPRLFKLQDVAPPFVAHTRAWNQRVGSVVGGGFIYAPDIYIYIIYIYI